MADGAEVIYIIIALAFQYSLMVFFSICCMVSSLRQYSRCSLSMVEFGIWQIVHSLDSYVPIFLKRAVRQSYPVWSLKFDTASFLGLPLYFA